MERFGQPLDGTHESFAVLDVFFEEQCKPGGLLAGKVRYMKNQLFAVGAYARPLPKSPPPEVSPPPLPWAWAGWKRYPKNPQGARMATTYNNIYLSVRRRLRAAEIPAAQLEAREIVCYVSGKTREEFFRDLTLYATGVVIAAHKTVEFIAYRHNEGQHKQVDQKTRAPSPWSPTL